MNEITGMGAPHTRRSFLDWVIAFCSAVAAVAMTVPGLMYLWPAARGGGAKRVEVTGASSLVPGQSVKIQVGGLVVIVVRGRSEYKAFSAVCTHLGCLVDWNSGKKRFLCPCHAAVFDEDGQVVAGPPPAPLQKLSVKEIKGKVYVSTA